MTGLRRLQALVAVESEHLTGARAADVEVASRAAARAMAERTGRRPQPPDGAMPAQSPWVVPVATTAALCAAVVGVCVLPVAGMEQALRLTVAAVLALVAAASAVLGACASLVGRGVDEGTGVQAATAGTLLVATFAPIVAGASTLADAATVVTGGAATAACIAAIVHALVQRPRRGRQRAALLAQEIGYRAPDAILEEVCSEALRDVRLRPDASPPARWLQEAADPGSPALAALCARHGVGAATVWWSALPGGDAVIAALDDSGEAGSPGSRRGGTGG